MRKWLIVFTLIFLVVLALDLYPGLRGGSGWQWAYALPQNWLPVFILAGLLVVYLVGVVVLRRRSVPVWISLVWVVLSGTVIALSVAGIRGDAGFILFTRTVSPVQTGASALAVRVMAEEGVLSTLRRWPEVMREAHDANLIHFTTSPPGQPLLHHVLASAIDPIPALSLPLSLALRPYQCTDLEIMRYSRGEMTSTLLGMLMPLWAALAGIPVYFSARMLYPPGDENPSSIALRLAQWWPLVPAVLLFAPTWNMLYPLLCVMVFALLLAGMRREAGASLAGWCFMAGLVMSFTTFLNFAVLPALLLFGIFTLGYWYFVRQGEGGFLWPVRVGLWFGLGLSVVWVVFWLVTGYTPFDLLSVTFEKHGLLVEREYLPWLVLHPYDVLMFAGWPLAGLFIGGVFLAGRRLLANRQVSRALPPVDVLALSMFVTFLLVNVSGVVQGENARILSFYMPFLLLAGWRLAAPSAAWDLPLLGAQAVTVLVMGVVLVVIPLDLNPQPEAPRTDVPTLDTLEPLPVGAVFTSDRFSGAFRLDSHRFIADLGEQVITLETIWEGGEQVERPYQFEITAYAENNTDGEIITEPFTWYAQNGNYLPTCWRPGERVHDVVLIPLPVVSAPVVWSLALRAVDERTGDVMRVTLPDGARTENALLGPVNYP